MKGVICGAFDTRLSQTNCFWSSLSTAPPTIFVQTTDRQLHILHYSKTTPVTL